MAGQIDPRLAADGPPGQGGLPHYVQQPPPLPPPQRASLGAHRADSLRADGGGYAQTTPRPYYHYPTPTSHTPHQAGASSVGSVSNQASPEQHAAYQLTQEHDDSPDNAGGDGQNGDDPKRPRACEACRGLKVRCDQDPAHPEIPCKRCAKAGRQCIITQPSRKRQKKADIRVAELEKKLDALTAALHQQQTGQPGHGAQFGPQAGSGAPAAETRGGTVNAAQPSGYAPGDKPSRKRQRMDGEIPEAQSAPQLSSRNSEDPAMSTFKEIEATWAPTINSKQYLHHTTPEEFVNRINSLIAPDMAAKLFDRYVNTLAPHLPAVVFPPGTSSEQVFRDKPILYVCILSASSFGMLKSDTSKQLGREAIGAIADCVVRNGAKSLELIQAMQVLALWYKPPEKAEQTNFYQIIHMAAVMALDIGLGKRFNPAKSKRGFGGPNANFIPGPYRILPQDSDTLEARRAWLTCYYLCASASMVLRRPNLVRWTNYMKECIEVLESHPDAFMSDKLFCQHVKIQHICEDIGLQFLMDDNTAQISITDPKVTYALNVLENQLKNWKENIPSECRCAGLQFFEHVTSLYLHEIALHFNHNIEDFRLPFTEESLKSVNNTSDTLTQNQMAALEACLRAAHGILDTICGMDIETIKSLPMLLFFVRCVYAIVILIKMHVAVSTPNSELGKMMKPEDLKVEFYMDALINLFSYVAREGGGEDARLPHPKILRILTVLKEWFGKHKDNVAQGQRGGASSGSNGGSRDELQQQREQYNQTPLHLLSQVATGNQQQAQQRHQQRQGSSPADWTFDSPTVVDHSRKPAPGHPDHRFPAWWNQRNAAAAQEVQASGSVGPSTTADQVAVGPAAYPGMPPDQQAQFGGMAGMVDPTNQDYGWGSGFEQAMDIAMGGVDGLQGGGLDNWFLGDGMAPFGFNGDMTGGIGGWGV